MANKADYVELGLSCADTCQAIDRGMKGRGDQPTSSALNAIERLTTSVKPATNSTGKFANLALNRRTIAEVQKHIVKRGKRNAFFRPFYPDSEEKIATWKADLDKIRHVFEVHSFAFV